MSKRKIKSALMFAGGVIGSIAFYHQVVTKNLDKLPDVFRTVDNSVKGV